jgi:chromosome segregation ATPase
LKLEQALDEYEKRKARSRKEADKIRKRYNKRLEKKVKEVLKRIDELERKEIPKDVDGNIRKIVTAERRNYVTALRNALGSVEDMESLGKRLPDLAKLHVGHGRYLLIIFEKEIYTINRLLKELSEEYAQYYSELMEKGLEELDIRETIQRVKETRENIKKAEEDIKKLRKRLDEAEKEISEFYEREGLPELEEKIRELTSKIKSEELEVRSKASKLQKPVKRMRLHEPLAEELVKDSSVALRKPEEFIEFIGKIEPKLDARGKKAAAWIVKNLVDKTENLKALKDELQRLEGRKEDILKGGHRLEEEAAELKRLIQEKEAELKKLRNRLEHLEKELNESIATLEKILGVEIER